jgi:hypothetical protein
MLLLAGSFGLLRDMLRLVYRPRQPSAIQLRRGRLQMRISYYIWLAAKDAAVALKKDATQIHDDLRKQQLSHCELQKLRCSAVSLGGGGFGKVYEVKEKGLILKVCAPGNRIHSAAAIACCLVAHQSEQLVSWVCMFCSGICSVSPCCDTLLCPLLLQRVPIMGCDLDAQNCALTSRSELVALVMRMYKVKGWSEASPVKFALVPSIDVVSQLTGTGS